MVGYNYGIKCEGQIGADIMVTFIMCIICLLMLSKIVWAHCDTVSGPVIQEAKAALERGNVMPLLKWVKKEYEAEVTAAFKKAAAVRKKGPDVQELADQYFIETLVRVHRAGEGEPYTGIKNELTDPIIALADKALTDGSADYIIKQLNAHAAKAIEQRFKLVLEAERAKDTNVEAGRKYVEAYVNYIHFIEGLHRAIISTGEHKHE